MRPGSDARQWKLYSDLAPAPGGEERFDELVAAPGVKVERIVSRGHRSPEGFWYDQEWAEWVLVLEGEAAVEIEGEEEPRRLGPGDALLLPAHCRHRVARTAEDGPTVWLAVHYPPAGDP